MKLKTPVAFLVTLGVLGGGLTLGIESSIYAFSRGRSAHDELETLARALTHVEEHYTDEVPLTDLVYSAIDGIAKSLDKHSQFFDPEEYRRLKEDNDGNYFGVGIQIRPHEDGGLLVVGVFEGGPAAGAGIEVSDQIVAVDGEDILGVDTNDIISRIRGPRGEVVSLGILRSQERIEIPVTRDAVHTTSIHAEWLGNRTAYVHISQFQKNTTAELNETLHELETTHQGTLERLILDLRQNPGGLLEEAANMVDLFIQEGIIVSTVGRSEHATEFFEATPGVDSSSLEIDSGEAWEALESMVILIDENSASAAEIVAGALQDVDRAILVGKTTYGKGSVQSIFEYPDQTALKFTIGRYHLPSGRSIDESGGVVPDEDVDYSTTDHAADTLRNELLTIEMEWKQYEQLSNLIDQMHPHKEESPAHRFKSPVNERISWDAQLARAVELTQQRP